MQRWFALYIERVLRKQLLSEGLLGVISTIPGREIRSLVETLRSPSAASISAVPDRKAQSRPLGEKRSLVHQCTVVLIFTDPEIRIDPACLMPALAFLRVCTCAPNLSVIL